jgi:hypothetical protein
MMMALLVFGFGVGPRTKDLVRSQCRDQWVFGNKPYIKFPLWKNPPTEVTILAHPEFLTAYVAYMNQTRTDWNGKPFPSTESASGSVTGRTLNNWLEALCIEAGMQYDDGSYPTIQNVRQTWHNQYLKALRTHKVQVKLVAEE